MIKKITARYGSFAYYGLAYTLSNGLQKGIGFIAFMVFASFLSVKEYASFGLNYSIFSAISGLAYAGILEAVISMLKEQENNDSRNSLFRSANSVFLVLSSISSLVAGVLIFSFYRSQVNNALEPFILIIGAVFSSFFIFQSIIIRLEEKHFLSIFYSFIPAVLGYLGGYISVMLFKTGFSFFIGSLIGYFISVVPAGIFFRKNFRGFAPINITLKPIAKRMPPYIIISFLGWFLGYGNTFMVKYLFQDFDVALFVFLYTIASIIQLLANSMNQVWSPRFFNTYNHENHEKIEKGYIRFTTFQGILLGSASLIILLAFSFAVQHFPKLMKFEHSEFQLAMLFGGYIVSIPWWHSQNYFMINNKGKDLMTLTLISGVAGYLVWVLCMIFLGKNGIYIGFFIQMLLRSLMIYLKARKVWRVSFDIKGILSGLALTLAGIIIIKYLFNGL